MVIGQTVNIPEAVQNEFKQKYPEIVKLKWQNKGDNYIAIFRMENQMQAYFTAEGKWIKTITMLTEEDIPESISEVIYMDYSDYAVLEFIKIEDSKGTTFQVSMADENDEKIKLKFTEEGSLIE